MKIQVLPPDVNDSQANFTSVGKDIRFGLTAVRNVGWNVVEQIIATRREQGRFTDFADFMGKVPAQVCNKRLIESLIKAGAVRRPATAAGRCAAIARLPGRRRSATHAEVLPTRLRRGRASTSTPRVASVEADPGAAQVPSFREHDRVHPDSDVSEHPRTEREDVQSSGTPPTASRIGQRAAVAGVLGRQARRPRSRPGHDRSPQRVRQAGDAARARTSRLRLRDGRDYVFATTATPTPAILAAGVKSPLSQARLPEVDRLSRRRRHRQPYVDTGRRRRRGPTSITMPIVAGRCTPPAGGQRGQDELAKARKDFRGAAAVLRFTRQRPRALRRRRHAPAGERPRDASATTSRRLPQDTAVAGRATATGPGPSASNRSSVAAATPGGARSTRRSSRRPPACASRGPRDPAGLLVQRLARRRRPGRPGGQEPADLPLARPSTATRPRSRRCISSVEARTGTQPRRAAGDPDVDGGKVGARPAPRLRRGPAAQRLARGPAVFKNAVPHAGESPFVLYVGLDDAWAKARGRRRARRPARTPRSRRDIDALTRARDQRLDDGGDSPRTAAAHPEVRLSDDRPPRVGEPRPGRRVPGRGRARACRR